METGSLDALDRRILLATQRGLPLVARPYHAVAERVDASAEEVMARMQRMLDAGIIRRIGAVPNHYALGYTANGMTVWDVADDRVLALGSAVGEIEAVSHCYLRPRRLPEWPYNLFAMVHGHDRAEVEQKARQIAELLGDACSAHTILYSTRILKKTGLRFA
jgi:DNA-binding Lrp family transcriptional regulator